MSDTPRTDDNITYMKWNEEGLPPQVDADFARQLERELAVITAEVTRLQELAITPEQADEELLEVKELLDKLETMTAAKNKAVLALKREHKELLLTQPPAGKSGDRWMERRDAVAELIADLEEVK